MFIEDAPKSSANHFLFCLLSGRPHLGGKGWKMSRRRRPKDVEKEDVGLDPPLEQHYEHPTDWSPGHLGRGWQPFSVKGKGLGFLGHVIVA